VKFFVPCAHDEAEAERIWAAVRMYLAGLGLPTTRRRIRALGMTIAGKDHEVAVGGEMPHGDDFVMVILESSNLDIFYVCTPSRGMVDDIPYPMALDDERWRVIDFEEEVCGHA
jgi:hypothetical protein